MSDPVYGATFDSVSNPAAIVSAMAKVPRKVTARVVFDEGVHAKDYVYPVRVLKQSMAVMGELLDSQYVDTYSVSGFQARVTEYLNAIPEVDIWEVANEVNGEWLGNTPDVVAKLTAAHNAVKSRGLKTAITTYYNKNCWSLKSHEMFTWVSANVPQSIRNATDYALISYYERDCENQRYSTAQWITEFTKFGQLFPNAALGFGEVGWSARIPLSTKQEMMLRYYTMTQQIRAAIPRYVGGYFWWNGRQDLVNNQGPLLPTFIQAVSSY